jgi:protein-S-isoprenylcysteine O-methyltransferase Ste14
VDFVAIMRKISAALGSVIFFLVAPCVVAGLGPWLVTNWHIHGAGPGWTAVHVAGGLLLAAGAAVLLQSFARFVTEGLGTPAPIAPTATLVVGGLYRYVRNPMYVAIDACLIGQTLLFGHQAMLWYTAAISLGQAAFVRFYEEPGLARRYGAEYDRYREHVPAWLPRLRPWTHSIQ